MMDQANPVLTMCDEAAERSVIGAILRWNECLDDLIPVLSADDFFTAAYGEMYAHAIAIHEAGKPIDLVTLADALKVSGKIEDVGGYGALGELWDAITTGANVLYHAEIVRGHRRRRDLFNVGQEVAQMALANAGPTEEMVTEAERKIFEIGDRDVGQKPITLREAMAEACDLIDARHNRDGSLGLKSGFYEFDETTAGFHNSELTIVGARPSHGKTLWAVNVAAHIAIDLEEPLLFVSLEQSRAELAERILVARAKVDSHLVRLGALNADDVAKLMKAGGEMSKAPLFIDDAAGQSIARIAATARRMKRRHGIKLVMIDYLQLVESPGQDRKNRQEQVAGISRRLKLLARDLKIPVVCLAQVNRGAEDRTDHKPRLSDLRESGSIEADADVVVLLHRPELYEPTAEPNVVHLIVAKQRNGPLGGALLTFEKNHMLLLNGPKWNERGEFQGAK